MFIFAYIFIFAFIGKLDFLVETFNEISLKRGKTVIRLKGVRIRKQDFPLRGDVFQDSVIEVYTSYYSSDIEMLWY